MAFNTQTAFALAQSNSSSGKPTGAEIQASHELLSRLETMKSSLSPAAADLLQSVVGSAVNAPPGMAARTTFNPFSITRKIDKSSPTL
jgi:type VI protein secretion system component Hcp